jgi:hypothetical protein
MPARVRTVVLLVVSVALLMDPGLANAQGKRSTLCLSLEYLNGRVAPVVPFAAAQAFNQGETNWAYFVEALGKTKCGTAQAVMAAALASGQAVKWLRQHKAKLTFRIYHDLRVHGRRVEYALITVHLGRARFRYEQIPGFG